MDFLNFKIGPHCQVIAPKNVQNRPKKLFFWAGIEIGLSKFEIYSRTALLAKGVQTKKCNFMTALKAASAGFICYLRKHPFSQTPLNSYACSIQDGTTYLWIHVIPVNKGIHPSL